MHLHGRSATLSLLISRLTLALTLTLTVTLMLTLTLRCVESRKAVKPPPDVADIIEQELGVHNIRHEPGPPCLLNIQKDLPKPNVPQPLYIVPRTESFWLPNPQGQVVVPRGASIELYCDQSYANETLPEEVVGFPKRLHTLQPVCLEDQTFAWQGQKYSFRQFICKRPPKYRVERLGISCGQNGSNDAELYRIGYNVTDGRFLETMQICHDGDLLRTHYVRHTMLPANLRFQMFVKRLNFSKAGHFGSHDMHRLYTKRNQQKQAEHLLFTEDLAKYFDEQSLYLARGHLAAKADLIYASQQRTTFTYFNAAPQWQSFNGGAWLTLEDQVRKFIAQQGLEVDCYTGTWGTFQLIGKSGRPEELYLARDANNNGLLPVPKIFYRVLVDRQRPKRGIALLGVNNPHASIQLIENEYVICTDIKEEVSWLRWMRNNNLKKGYLYACEVAEMAEVVGHLPPQLNKVSEVLMSK